MKAAEKDLILQFFGKTLNLTAEEVAPLFEKKGDEEELKPDALKFLLEKDVARVKTMKDEVATVQKESFDKGYKKAQGEALSKFEKEIKEQYGVNSQKQGADLIAEIVTAKAAPGSITDDAVKTHALYLKLEKEMNEKAEAVKKEWEGKLNERETQIAREKVLSSVISKADKIVADGKFILPKDAEKAKNQKQLLVNELNQYTFEEKNGEMLILKDGKRVEDAHGAPVKFDDLVKNTASKYWDSETGPARQGSGGSNDPNGVVVGNITKITSDGKTINKWNGPTPKTEDEYAQMAAKLTSADERIALLDHYEASQKA